MKRLKNRKILLLLPILLLVIGAMGLVLGILFYGQDASPKMWLVSVYNSYTQFTFLFMIYVFVSTFSDDFAKGIYAFMKQVGYPLNQCIFTKAIAMYLVSFLGTNLFLIMTNIMSGNTDDPYLLMILVSVNLSLIFIILFAIVLSLLVKKTLAATLTGYGLFLLMDVLNFVGFGLTNPSDGNSISSVAIRVLAGQPLDHYSLSRMNLDFEKYGFLYATIPVLAWVLVLLLAVMFLVKKETDRNEI
ncbi:MAG: hypothetical protein LBQ15_10635 [Clostridium sp.]|nr:hypothetical protein [Clostridium sp.]